MTVLFFHSLCTIITIVSNLCLPSFLLLNLWLFVVYAKRINYANCTLFDRYTHNMMPQWKHLFNFNDKKHKIIYCLRHLMKCSSWVTALIYVPSLFKSLSDLWCHPTAHLLRVISSFCYANSTTSSPSICFLCVTISSFVSSHHW